MTLAVFGSFNEAKHFNKVARREVWVGINDSDKEGEFVRVTDKQKVDIPWDYGEPNNAAYSEHCVQSVPGKNFNDNRCGSEIFYSCEKVEIFLNEDDGAVDSEELLWGI